MDDFQRELNELKSFIADLKADRASTKEKEKREAWTKYVSLTVVIIAVIAAIASQSSGKYGSRVLTQLNEATFNQTKASDEWAFYQAKSIKEKIYLVGRDQLATDSDQTEKKIDVVKNYEAQIAKQQSEQKEIRTNALNYQNVRDSASVAAKIASAKGGRMGLAISFYSVSIAMASICLVTKKKPLWFMAMILAGIGAFYMIQAWLA
jgi:hypothetical protein